MKNFESIKDERDQYSSKLTRLYEIGLFDKEGDPTAKEADSRLKEEEEIRF